MSASIPAIRYRNVSRLDQTVRFAVLLCLDDLHCFFWVIVVKVSQTFLGLVILVCSYNQSEKYSLDIFYRLAIETTGDLKKTLVPIKTRPEDQAFETLEESNPPDQKER